MRSMIGSTAASLLLIGAVGALATPASAEDDIYFNHAKGTMSGAIPQSAPAATDRNGQYVASHQQYMQVDPRDAKPNSSAESVDANNVYFNHAKGTMSGDSGANYAATTDQSGQYTASYHQYMQMDPRDMKADPNAGGNVDASNVYFNHAKGTMSGN